MTYIVQNDDNDKPMLVDYYSGCGCCAEYHAVNGDPDATYYGIKHLDHGKVEEAVLNQIHTLETWINQLQEYGKVHGLNLKESQ